MLVEYLLLLTFQLCFNLSRGQYNIIQRTEVSIDWCTVDLHEQDKCLMLSKNVSHDAGIFDSNLKVTCLQASNKDECMTLIDQGSADITSLDAGEVFVAGRFHSLIPIAQEINYDKSKEYYAVAVIKKSSLPDVTNLYQLRNKKACFAGVETLAGWVIPIETLMKYGGLEVVDCNNHIKSTTEFFGPSCAVNSLVDKYNPIGDNSNKLCELCIGRSPGEKCTPADPYAGFEGAFRCLVEAGEVAFLKHTTVFEMTEMAGNRTHFVSIRADDFELLCRDGSRRPVNEYRDCYWGIAPSNAIVTSSAKSLNTRRLYQTFLEKAASTYSRKSHFGTENYSNFNSRTTTESPSYRNYLQNNAYSSNSSNSPFLLFDSLSFGRRHNLLMQDSTEEIHKLDENSQTYSEYLGPSLELIFKIRQCPVNRMTLCVTSEPELDKCRKMTLALKAQLLKPEMSCLKAQSHLNCMRAIRSGTADVTVLDAGDVYTAGLFYDEIPFISEVYNLGRDSYYSVAVAKEEDQSTELTYLRGKYTCHPGMFNGGGWVVPMAYLLSNGWIRSYGCNSALAASQYFSKSCVPGALSPEFGTTPYDNLCHLCHGASYRQCRRDASEDYYGYTGAFKCLVEGGGDVAFLKHTTVYENADGRKKEWWARNSLKQDFQLLCPDGTRAELDDYERCNLGTVKANAIVTRGGEAYNQTELNAYINLFIYAQQLYSRKSLSDFSMFTSPAPFSDLIFQDATQQLRVIEPSKRHYENYLGKDFMRARRLVDCHAGTSATQVSQLVMISCLFIYLIFSEY